MNESLLKHEDIPSMPYVPLHPSMPGSKYGGGQFSHLYNGMISPLYQFKIKGALWYQGENNGEEERTYVEKISYNYPAGSSRLMILMIGKKVGSFAERHNWLVLQKYRIPVLP